MNIYTTDRGFKVAEFTDYYGNKCSLQKSSLANEDCIWLGIDDPTPKVMASRAETFGLITEKKTGWIPYPIPKDVAIYTRMHLSREQVAAILPTLQKFIDTGEI